jgi:predicted small integral membrane protein
MHPCFTWWGGVKILSAYRVQSTVFHRYKLLHIFSLDKSVNVGYLLVYHLQSDFLSVTDAVAILCLTAGWAVVFSRYY